MDPRRPEKIETGLQKMAANFRKDYARQLGRLVERAREQKQRRAFIVFGLVNFKSFFEARDAAEQLRKENPKLYPYFEVDYKHYESMKPEYRANMVKLALMINEELRAMVGEFNRKLGGDSQVRLEYSDALATVDLSDVESIHRMRRLASFYQRTQRARRGRVWRPAPQPEFPWNRSAPEKY